MSQRPLVIDGAKFARDAGLLEGTLDAVSLPRLGEVLAENRGSVRFRVAGEKQRDGRLFLVLHVEGELPLRCQRCLGTLDFPLQVTTRLQLIEPGAAWPDDDLTDDSFDAIEAQRELDVAWLVEEEVLLALPLAGRHEDCALPQGEGADRASSAFAVLATLTGRGRQGH